MGLSGLYPGPRSSRVDCTLGLIVIKKLGLIVRKKPGLIVIKKKGLGSGSGLPVSEWAPT